MYGKEDLLRPIRGNKHGALSQLSWTNLVAFFHTQFTLLDNSQDQLISTKASIRTKVTKVIYISE
jgi:hypothetical protein